MDMFLALTAIAALGFLTYWWESSFERKAEKHKQELEMLKDCAEWQEWTQAWQDWERG